MTKGRHPNMSASNEGLSPRLKLVLVITSILACISLLLTLMTDYLYNPNHFNITKITLTGDAAHVDRASLTDSVSSLIDGNYFSLDSHRLLKVLNELSWVETARLRRQWPDTLMINIEEYQPIALWGKERWLTTSGKLVTLPLPKNIVLPQLEGPDDQVELVWKKYQDWTKKLASLGLRLRNMRLSDQHLYTLKLERAVQGNQRLGGIELVLLESNADQQMRAFVSSYRQEMIAQPSYIKKVDLRYPHGFSVSHHPPDKLAQVTN